MRQSTLQPRLRYIDARSFPLAHKDCNKTLRSLLKLLGAASDMDADQQNCGWRRANHRDVLYGRAANDLGRYRRPPDIEPQG